MIDIRFLRENPDAVRENIRKKFQDEKLPLVDEAIRLDAEKRAAQQECEQLKAARNKLSKANGPLYGQLKKADEAQKAELQKQIEENNAKVKADDDRRAELEKKQAEAEDKLREIMYVIPNIIDPSVPIGPDDSHNVEVQRFGEPVVPDFEIPHHVDIMQSFDGIDKDSAGRVAGMGFYYLLGDIARLHEAVLAYARDFMIDEKHFTYVIPPFMMHGSVVKGVMSFPEMEAMMYKIEGEDLYLIGTSEHTMIGRFIDQIIPEAKLPLTLTSYSPCFRKEVGSHGLEERGVYRIHQFEKQEMIVVCRPEESMDWYNKLWSYSVELFRNLEIPVRQLECCSGDLADLKVKSCDIEAWSPRQKKYFEVCSCSNLGDAQARRLSIRVKGADGKMYLAHTLNNTCVAPPRMLIAFLENHLQKDGSVTIPKCLQPYMGGKEDKLDEVLAEIPRVREDAGYPPLVTPTSQIVGTQAVFNVIMGERYKMVTKEFKGLVHGDYGKTPAPIKPEFTKKILGDEQPITCRFADTLAPEMDKLKAEAAKWATQEEDVLTYAMFPQVAPKFFDKRNAKKQGVDGDHVDYTNQSHPV